MAIDTQQKRMSVIGVGRPYLRSHQPSAISTGWRASIGLIYSGFASITLPLLRIITGSVIVNETVTDEVDLE